ncbi:MAG: hypothetical protein ACE5ET_06210 [Gammaproteobacteria bacterium]
MQTTTRTMATLMLAAIITAACTTAAPERQAQQAAASSIAKPVERSYTTDQVRNLMQILSAHRRTLFSSSSGEYSYFIGGVLSAVYNPAKGGLTITPESAAGEKPCIYNGDGQLLLEGYAGTSRELRRAACDTLLSTLESSLAIP